MRAAGRLIEARICTGKHKETAVAVVGEGGEAHRLLLVGLGVDNRLTLQVIREAAGVAGSYARKNSLARCAIIVPVGKVPQDAVASAIVEGFILGAFRFTEYRKAARNNGKPIALTIVAPSRCGAAVKVAAVLADAQNIARDLAFRPGNEINPVTLAGIARQAAEDAGLSCRVLDEKQLARLGMGGILAVGAGAKATPPRLIVLDHAPRGVVRPPVLLVGKTVTFDTGGISIKPSEKMGRMIFDKCGGMAVLGAMVAVAKLKLPVRVIGILAAAENHISERAYRPGDILRMYNGVTVEVTNTDAEGRLVLGDAMAWGIEEFAPRVCLDMATLTGGVIVALGRSTAGIMGNDQQLIERLIAMGKEQGERMWQLPLPEEPAEMLKSEYADIVNSAGRDAHPLQGAAFLSFFLPQAKPIPWAHLDIAGVADTERETPLYIKGATGWGVRTLVRWLAEQK